MTGAPQRHCYLSIVCLLLTLTFASLAAQLRKPRRCPTCPEGYFVTKNCSVINGMTFVGVQCERCTVCSAVHQDSLVQCSTFADSLCANKTTPTITSKTTDPPVSAPKVWITLTVIGSSLVLVLLLGVFVILLSCRKWNKLKDTAQKQLF